MVVSGLWVGPSFDGGFDSDETPSGDVGGAAVDDVLFSAFFI